MKLHNSRALLPQIPLCCIAACQIKYVTCIETQLEDLYIADSTRRQSDEVQELVALLPPL